MDHRDNRNRGLSVALLAEGVDRNSNRRSRSVIVIPSPSSRRAWIEINTTAGTTSPADVALLAEGVDRNSTTPQPAQRSLSRPPRGGRG